ncbi:MAG: P-loop NTPase [Armatimonadetes bacterium]|jgi:Mrp family chromosome partitioning ATPase/predicted Fe-Mo cluster-binding NifX family protein|nr:P-loop NTPase [Armatimonadota bacterium]
MSQEHSCGAEGCGAGQSGCGSCGAENAQTLDQFMESLEREDTLRRIKHKIVVLSGKGGVGKSTIAVNLAVSLGLTGNKVGLLDVDIHGPSVPKMLHLEEHRLESNGRKLIPAEIGNIKVMSIGFMLQDAQDAVIWRGPMKAGVIKQFVEEVEWGNLDYLIVDCPPGTGDEPLSIIQTLQDADGAVIVTTPQDVALADVAKSIHFCAQLNLKVLGVVENMSGFACPHCSETVDIFKSGGGEQLAESMNVPFLGRVPLDPVVVTAGDSGTPYIYNYSNSAAARAFEPIAAGLENAMKDDNREEKKMLIALPTSEGQLCMHFGHSDKFSIFEIDDAAKKIVSKTVVIPPPHEPGLLPKWLHSEGVSVVIAGGMGQRAQDLFTQAGVKVVVGAKPDDPEKVVLSYLNGDLQTGENVCDH